MYSLPRHGIVKVPVNSVGSTEFTSAGKYPLSISRQIQKSKNGENPTSTSKDTQKIIFISLFKLFSIRDSFEIKAT